MSNVKCEVCGRPITRCPACFATLPTLPKYKGETDFKFPAIPVIEIDRPATTEETNQEADWNYKTTLPTGTIQQTNFSGETTKPALSQYFDENANVCTCLRDDDGNVLPNPNIKRESITAAINSSPYSPQKVRGSYGDHNVEELAKIAVEQQMRVEKRKKRRNRWIRRGIGLVIILILIFYNWDFVYFACRTFLNGIGAVFEIFGLLGDLEYHPPIQ